MCKVSVIVPVYNMENYLDECMSSLLGQTLKEIEVICVDDGSKDKSAKLLDMYAKKDSRVKVFHKINTGYGDSVNVGMDHAVGEYVGIVEPDDYVAIDAFKSLYDLAYAEHLDMAKGNFSEFWGEEGKRRFKDKKVIENPDYYAKVIVPSEDCELFRGYIINPAGIYNRKFLINNRIRHNTTAGASYQDIGFWFQVMAIAKRVKLLDKTVYYYRRDNESSSVNDRGKVFCICDEYDFLFRFMKRNGEQVKDIWPYYLCCMLASYMATYNRIAIRYRKEFIEKAHVDFSRLLDKGVMDTSVLYTWELEELDMLLYNPAKLFDNSMKVSRELHDKLKGYENAIIYGAGIVGTKLLMEMYDEEFEKVKGFAVTKTGSGALRFNGKMVCCIEEYLAEKDKIAVIVGVSKQYQMEVLETLEAYGFSNVILVEM